MNIIYKILVIFTCLGFISVGVISSVSIKDWKILVASTCLGIANFLLLYR